MKMKLKARRVSVIIVSLGLALAWLIVNPSSYDQIFTHVENTGAEEYEQDTAKDSIANEKTAKLALDILQSLEVKGRAPKTGYKREEFYDGWPEVDGCNLRQRIIKREFGDSAVLDGCSVIGGEYDEPYTGEHRVFTEREQISKGIQIDHVVALSDAWQKGAQYQTAEGRYQMATDPLNLLAVDATANKQKSDGDAATWLPSNKAFRCQYIARQISVKYKYKLWLTAAEKEAMIGILQKCPNQTVIGV